ncbi:hypothetical protein DFS34DRAFT_578592 [Phlyctochytrium arcticum]|nr:hypothetical protein DFS34DRAFT_578592 [Phlyctochytrium arcticum]
MHCRFFALGSCTKSNCTFIHDRDNSSKAVCSYYLKGHCRFDNYCALSHEKPGKPTKAPAKSVPAAAQSAQSNAAGSTASVQNDVPVIPVPPAPVPESRYYDPYELTEQLAAITQIPEQSIPSTSSYSAITRVGLAPSTDSAVVDEKSIPATEDKGDRSVTLCPFAFHGNCRFGDHRCRYVHGLQCPVCRKFCLDPRESKEQHQEHIVQCQLDVSEDAGAGRNQSECVICMEIVSKKPDPRYGLLECEHCVCLTCIREWRGNQVMDTSKSCPICRTTTHFITPSVIWPRSAAEKEKMIDTYRQKLRAVDCKHYNYGQGSCPFGTSCFYRHVTRDGIEESVKLRIVQSDEDTVRVVNVPRLSDFLDAYEGRRM